MTAVAFDDVASDVGAAFSFNEYFCMFIIIISEKTHSALLVVRIGCNELSIRKQTPNVFQLSEDQRSDDACLFLLFLLALCAMPTKPKRRNSGQSGISKRYNWIEKTTTCPIKHYDCITSSSWSPNFLRFFEFFDTSLLRLLLRFERERRRPDAEQMTCVQTHQHALQISFKYTHRFSKHEEPKTVTMTMLLAIEYPHFTVPSKYTLNK